MHKIEIVANDDDLVAVKAVIDDRDLPHLIQEYKCGT